MLVTVPLKSILAALVLLGGSAQALTYRVKPGDNLYRIALRAGVSERELQQANPALRGGHRLYAGQQLQMPDRVGARRAPAPLRPGEFRVRQGETLAKVTARLGISQRELRRANPQIDRRGSLYAGQALKLPTRAALGAQAASVQRVQVKAAPRRAAPITTYRVRSGDSFYTIAQRHGLTTAQLQRFNPRYAQSTLMVGAVLQLRPVVPAMQAKASGPGAGRGSSTTAVRMARTSSAWAWPVPGYGRVTSGYGLREIDEVEEMHRGIDIAAPAGTAVLAARSGRVIEARADNERGWGLTVVVQHPGGWLTRYAHLSSLSVEAGQLVRQGERVGQVGSTGRVTGTHLHFGLYRSDWSATDPLLAYNGD